MEEALTKANDDRAKKLQNLINDESKKRIGLKRKREIEQEVRKQWLQEQETNMEMLKHMRMKVLSQTAFAGLDDASVVTSKKTCVLLNISIQAIQSALSRKTYRLVTPYAKKQSCKRGSTEHLRTSLYE